MIEVYKVDLTKEKLEAMPAKERQLLLLLGHAANEINVLRKLSVMASSRIAKPDELVSHVEDGQWFILMRILIGKLREARKLFYMRLQKKNAENKCICDKYLPMLEQNAEAKKALAELDYLLDEKSTLAAIRNKLAFHYDDKDNLIEKNLKELPDDHAMQFYLSDIVGNSFYHASEMIVAGAAINLANHPGATVEDDHLERYKANLDHLLEQTKKASRVIMVLFGELIAIIMKEHFPDIELGDPIRIADAPSLKSIHIPFFVDPDATP